MYTGIQPCTMESHELGEIDHMYKEALTWSKETLHLLQKPCGSLESVCLKDLNRLNKPEVVNVCIRALHFVGHLMNNVDSLKKSSSSLQNRLIESQQQIISVQVELSECKTEQLETLKKTVESSVADSVKAEFKTYSSVVQSSQTSRAEPALSKEVLKTVVKDVVDEEDRSRNVVVFGLAEEDGENITGRVEELFDAIDHKLKVEGCRLGRKKNDSIRPVKVILSSSTVADQIVACSRRLRLVEKFRNVFVSPDRSPDQRRVQKELVTKMKERMDKEPGKKFYIRDGQIHSVERTVK